MGPWSASELTIHRDLLGTHVRAALAGWRHQGLLSPAGVDEICSSQAAHLPAEMTSRFGFECRLGEQEPIGDFLVRVGAQQEEWAALEHYAADLSSFPWTGIRSLLIERAARASRLAAELKNLWLEYDFAVKRDRTSVPSVFLGTDGLTSGAATESAMNAIGILRARPLPSMVRRTLQGLVAALPKKAKLFQAGVMCSRPDSPLRLCFLGPEFVPCLSSPAAGGETGLACKFLAAAPWPADPAPVAELLRTFASSIDQVALDLDLRDDGSLAPRLGIEIYQNPARTSARRIVALVSQLTRCGLCTVEKANGLLAWNGVAHERLHPNLWPRSLVAARVIRGGDQYSTFCRWLHHVKLVYEPGESLTAKAYLAVSHAFLTDAKIRETRQPLTGDEPIQPVGRTCYST
jgi:hypothetical protein